jgi:cytochrome P460
MNRVRIPPGYRDWRLISVAHEASNLNDLRAILGNDRAVKAYREGKRSFADGAIIARLAWSYVPSEENNKAFGRSRADEAMHKAGFPCHQRAGHDFVFTNYAP